MAETFAQRPPLFSTDKKTAIDAKAMAQFIAFAPYVFQASIILRDNGILKEIEMHREGISLSALAAKANMSEYAMRVLLEAGLGIGLICCKEGKYFLAKTGHFFLNDAMTRINTDFMRDVCYDGAEELEASLKDGKPRGLKHLGDWETIYQGLPVMNEPAKSSWYNFDHYHSDHTFSAAMPLLFAGDPKRIMDIGANTGKFALACLEYNAEVEIGLVDLPVQLDATRPIIEDAGYSNRVQFFGIDLLDAKAALPKGYDVIWMSQFLDCFAEDQVVSILQRCHEAIDDGGRIFISETFWDRQRFETSAFSLHMISLYFTTMANGNSQMYAYELFHQMIDKAGFEVVNITDNIAYTHSILELAKK